MLKAGALALAISAAAASAQAEPLFDAYQTICAKTYADAEGAMAAADASGWNPIPEATLQQLGAGIAVSDAHGRWKSDAGGMAFMIVGQKQMPVSNAALAMRFCAVATSTLPAGDEPKAELAAWANVPAEPKLSGEGRIGYAFTDNAGNHTVMTKLDSAEGKALIRAGHVRVALIQEAKGLTLLAFAVPTM